MAITTKALVAPGRLISMQRLIRLIPSIGRTRSLTAVVDCPRNFALEITATNNSINVAVFKQEFARLKARRKFHAKRSLNRSRTSKTDERLRLSEHQVAQLGKACCNTAHRRV